MIINNRFQVDSLIGQGSFSSVYSGKDLETSNQVAIKLCQKHLKYFFKVEVQALSKVSGKKGFPKLISYGETDEQYYLIMTLLGQSLTSKLYEDGHFGLEDTCELGQQMVKVLKRLHGCSYLHRDIKPENIVFKSIEISKKLKKIRKNGRKKKLDVNYSDNLNHNKRLSRKLYCLIDFGLAKKYWDSKSKWHIPMKTNFQFKGNLIFCSNNVLSGIEPSCRDDLVSLCLILIFILKKGLPWMRHTQSIENMIGCRSSINISELLNGVNIEIAEIYNYVLSLGFYQKPDYEYMVGLIRKMKNIHKMNKSEIVEIRIKNKRSENVKKTLIMKSKTEDKDTGVLQSSCSTVKLEAPDFSKEMLKKIKLLRMQKIGLEHLH